MHQPQQETIKIEKNGKVYLTLPEGKEYKQCRNIGFIRDHTFCTTRKKNHLFRKFNAFGLSYKLLNEGENSFDRIKIEYDFHILETSREFYLAKGKFKHYQQNDLELQIFLPLDQYGFDKVNEWNIEKEKEKEKKKNEKQFKFKKAVIQFSMF